MAMSERTAGLTAANASITLLGLKRKDFESDAGANGGGKRYKQSAPTKFVDLSGHKKGVNRAEVVGAHAEHHGKDSVARAGVSLLGAAAKSSKGIAAANAGIWQAGASASKANWSAGAQARLLTAGAAAEAHGVHSEAGAEATVGKATARVGTGLKALDKHLQVGVSAPTAGAKAEASLETLTLSGAVGASAGEASAGPFAVRAGVKVGGGIEGGVPVVHLGPVSTPCCIQ